MHSSQRAVWTQSLRSNETRVCDHSFPPTQRYDLLGSSPSRRQRSTNQAANLLRSSRELLDELNVQPLEHAAAL